MELFIFFLAILALMLIYNHFDNKLKKEHEKREKAKKELEELTKLFNKNLKESRKKKTLSRKKLSSKSSDVKSDIEKEATLMRMEFNYDKYKNYIKTSPLWKLKRLERLEIDNFMCVSCCKQLTEQTAHVHHKNYESLYNEKMKDLETLCPTCHEQAHIKQSGKANEYK